MSEEDEEILRKRKERSERVFRERQEALKAIKANPQPIFRTKKGVPVYASDLEELSAKEAMSVVFSVLDRFDARRSDSEEDVRHKFNKLLTVAKGAIWKVDQLSMINQGAFGELASNSDSWPIIRRVKWAPSSTPLLDLCGIELGSEIRKGKGASNDDFRKYLEIGMSLLERKRAELKKGIHTEFEVESFGAKTLELLGQHTGFSSDSIAESVTLLAEFYLNMHRELKYRPSEKDNPVYEGSKSNIEAKRDERIVAKLKRLDLKYPKGEHSDPVQSTQYIVQKKEILSTPITEGDIKSGLRKTIKSRLLTILK